MVALSTFLAALLAITPAAEGGTAAVGPTLDVIFGATGAISVTLPDRTPVGSTAGTPTVIPAGYYTLLLSGPGGCNELPYLELKGPGVNILNDMDLGEVTASINTYFLPNSTYVWIDQANPDVVYTFATSGTVEGTPPAPTSAGPPRSSTTSLVTTTSQDVVGSGIAPARGRLTGAVSAVGRLTLLRNGRSVTRLSSGRYTITVTDRSTTNGFMLEKKAERAAVSLTGVAFVGERSVSVDLTAGRWFFVPRAGKATHSILVG